MGDNIKVGYSYYFDLHFGLCHGEIDGMPLARVGGRDLSLTVLNSDTEVLDYDSMERPGEMIDADYVYAKNVDVAGWGILIQDNVINPTELSEPLLDDLHGVIRSKFKGVCTFFFSGLIGTLDPFPKRWEWRLQRTHAGWGEGGVWYPEKARIVLGDVDAVDSVFTQLVNEAAAKIYAMNPAHILYQALTNTEWGCGLDPSMLDESSFISGADTLYAENFGLCLYWSRQVPLSEFMQGVLDHIGAVLLTNRQTGLMTFRLMRDDYVINALPLFSYSTGLLAIDEMATGSVANAVNEIIVKYEDPVAKETLSVRVTNLAAIQTNGVISETIDYPGIPTADLAARVAQRDLAAKSGLIKRLKIRLDRRAWALEPGMVFRISAPDFGIGEMVLRALRFEDGTATSGAITVVAVQDVFALAATSYAAPQPSAWQPPQLTAVAVEDWLLQELNYQQLIQRIEAPQFALLDDSMCFAGTLAQRPTPLTLMYLLQTRVGSAEFSTRYEGDFCATAVLDSPADKTTSVFNVVFSDAAKNEGLVLLSALQINSEIMRLESYDLDAGTITVSRGCIDTVRTAHASESDVWFYHRSIAIDTRDYVDGVEVDARLVPSTSNGSYSESLADVETITLASRFARPYAPGKFRIDGAVAPSMAVGNVVLTWAHRDRVLQADQIIDDEVDSIGPEPGTTYTAKMTDANDSEAYVIETDITGTTATLDAPGFSGEVIIELWAVRDGLTSWSVHTHQLIMLANQPRLTETGELRLTADDNIRTVE